MNNAIENHDCPPIMSDGRHFTDYRPSCMVHDLFLKQNAITNSYDLKLLLTNKAEQIQKINRQYYEAKNGCLSCGGYYLPDPNGHVDMWSRYAKDIGYGQTMTLGCPVKQPAKIPVSMPSVNACQRGSIRI